MKTEELETSKDRDNNFFRHLKIQLIATFIFITAEKIANNYVLHFIKLRWRKKNSSNVSSN